MQGLTRPLIELVGSGMGPVEKLFFFLQKLVEPGTVELWHSLGPVHGFSGLPVYRFPYLLDYFLQRAFEDPQSLVDLF